MRTSKNNRRIVMLCDSHTRYIMNQESIQTQESIVPVKDPGKKLKKRIIIVMICMVAFAVIAIPLISLLEKVSSDGGNTETVYQTPVAGNFAEPDYDYNILLDDEYRKLDRTIDYTDAQSGVMYKLDSKNLDSFGEPVGVMHDLIQTIIMGNHDAYNELFSETYFVSHRPEGEFTMQQLYDIELIKIDETGKTDANGKTYTETTFEVKYKIRLNNGTYRTDIGHDEAKAQVFVLSSGKGRETLIENLYTYNYTHRP